MACKWLHISCKLLWLVFWSCSMQCCNPLGFKIAYPHFGYFKRCTHIQLVYLTLTLMVTSPNRNHRCLTCYSLLAAVTWPWALLTKYHSHTHPAKYIERCASKSPASKLHHVFSQPRNHYERQMLHQNYRKSIHFTVTVNTRQSRGGEGKHPLPITNHQELSCPITNHQQLKFPVINHQEFRLIASHQ